MADKPNLKYSDIQKAVQTLRDARVPSDTPRTVWVSPELLLEAGWTQDEIDKLPTVGEDK